MKRENAAGFTLLELVIAVSIAAIMVRIGFDVYSGYIMRSNRAVARSTLVNLASKQELQILQNSAYATSFTSLNGYSGTPATSFYINQEGQVQSASDGSTIYQISFTSTLPSACGTTGYAFQAVAQGTQAARDTSCKTLTLCSVGIKQAQDSSGTIATDPTTCWDK